MKKVLGQRLKELRKINQINQVDFSESVSITQASLSAYETGSKCPTLDVLLRIANKYNVSLDWLCGNTERKCIKSGADIIDIYLELESIYGLNFDFVFSPKKHTVSTHPFSGELLFTGEIFSDFINEYKKLEKQLASLNDAEIKKNYMEMWLEKEKKKYADYKILPKEAIEQLPDAFKMFYETSIDKCTEQGDKKIYDAFMFDDYKLGDE